MARPRKVFINPAELLAGIAGACEQEHAELTRLLEAERASCHVGAWMRVSALKYELDRLERDGVRIDFPTFMDSQLTGTERLRCQQTLRRLEAEGLVTILGQRARYVKPTAAGLAQLSSDDTSEGRADA